MKVLTIVIPSYNSAIFTRKNIGSFIDERLFERTEVLIINDGSQDNTSEVAAEYEKQYPGFIRLINKENGGHGSVINLGIREASGRYFKVVDADDWVNTENLVRLVADIEKSNADLVVNPYIDIDEGTAREKRYDYAAINSLPAEGPFTEVVRQNILIPLHSATFKTSILQNNNIMVTEKCYYEDFQYVLFPVPYIQTATVLNYPVYWRLIGQKTQSVDASNALKNVEMSYKVFCDSVRYYEKNKGAFSQTLKDYFEWQICVFLRSIYNTYLRNLNAPDVLARMLEMDAKLKAASPEFYRMVGAKNRYVQMMRKGKWYEFKMISIAFSVRKKILEL